MALPDDRVSGDRGDEIAAVVASGLRDVADFPQPGVLFKDISGLLADHGAFSAAVVELSESANEQGPVELISGVEARGFVVASALAAQLRCGLALTRKAGKLPPPTVRRDYALEYGQASLEVPLGLLEGRRVYLVDDVLATGGTLAAAAALLTQAGAHVTGIGVLLELQALAGRAALPDVSVTALLRV